MSTAAALWVIAIASMMGVPLSLFVAITAFRSWKINSQVLSLAKKEEYEKGEEFATNEVARILGSIFYAGRSILGGSPPPMWTARSIAWRIQDNLSKAELDLLRTLEENLMEAIDNAEIPEKKKGKSKASISQAIGRVGLRATEEQG